MKRRALVTATVFFFALGLVPALLFAQANEALFDYQVNAKVQTDQGTPMLILEAREFIQSGKVVMHCSNGKSRTVRLGKMQPGEQKRISFRQPKGTFKWKVQVSGKSQFNQTMKQSFETEVTWAEPIKLHVDPQKVNIGQGQLYLGTNVPLSKVDIEVFDKDGKKFVTTTQNLGGQSGDVLLSWSPARDDVGAVRLKAYDKAGFWSAVVLEPFWVQIPHREVNFDFGKATWQPTETPKLNETLSAVRDAMKKHAKQGLRMQLYIAGYTDTVGSKADNMKLSASRAKAIAHWFRKSGVKIPIYYQGFGESVLAKPTPDNTAEAANRRALYILGNAPPPTSGQIPRAHWHRL